MELDKSLTQIEFERYEDQLALKKNSIEQLRMKLDKNLFDAEISDKIKLLNINKLQADLEDARRLAKGRGRYPGRHHPRRKRTENSRSWKSNNWKTT